jgi:hypothetical protein
VRGVDEELAPDLRAAGVEALRLDARVVAVAAAAGGAVPDDDVAAILEHGDLGIVLSRLSLRVDEPVVALAAVKLNHPENLRGRSKTARSR